MSDLEQQAPADQTPSPTSTPHDSPMPASSPPESSTPLAAPSILNRDRLGNYMLVVLLIGLTLAFVPIIRLFFVPLVLAATFATLFYPLYESILRFLGGRRPAASLLTCFILLIGLLVPIYLLIHLVVLQSITLYSTAEPLIKDLIQKGSDSDVVKYLNNLQVVRWFQLTNIDLPSTLREGVKAFAGLSTTIINRTSAGVFGLVANVFTMLFIMFYFFMDGKHFVKRLRYLSPLKEEYEKMFFSRFLLTSRATIKGTVLIGLIQGTLGAVTLLVFGVRTWLLWGFIMVVLAIMPLVGAWLVLLPAAIIQFILGNVWQGVGILLVSTLVISNVDNVLRPRLVGRDAKMHDLMIFFSTLGGISVFGLMGFIVGPVLGALFITALDIYGAEFKPHLSKDTLPPPTRTNLPIIETPPVQEN